MDQKWPAIYILIFQPKFVAYTVSVKKHFCILSLFQYLHLSSICLCISAISVLAYIFLIRWPKTLCSYDIISISYQAYEVMSTSTFCFVAGIAWLVVRTNACQFRTISRTETSQLGLLEPLPQSCPWMVPPYTLSPETYATTQPWGTFKFHLCQRSIWTVFLYVKEKNEGGWWYDGKAQLHKKC